MPAEHTKPAPGDVEALAAKVSELEKRVAALEKHNADQKKAATDAMRRYNLR